MANPAPLSLEEIQGARMLAASEIARRFKSPAAMARLNGVQLTSLTTNLLKLTEPLVTQDGPGAAEGELDFATLIGRLPVEARKEHLLREQRALLRKLEAIDALLGEDDRERANLKNRRKYRVRNHSQLKEPVQVLVEVE